MTAQEMRREVIRLDPGLVHKDLGIGRSVELRLRKWSEPYRTYAATLVAMADSDRMPYEFEAALAALNPLLDARLAALGDRAERLDALAAEVLKHAIAVGNARSGMACDLCLDYFYLALNEVRKDLGFFVGDDPYSRTVYGDPPPSAPNG